MKTLLLIGLIFSLIIYAWKIGSWTISFIRIQKKDQKVIDAMEMLYSTRKPKVQIILLFAAIFEHIVIFSTLLACLLIIF
jgi:hypothetical protein